MRLDQHSEKEGHEDCPGEDCGHPQQRAKIEVVVAALAPAQMPDHSLPDARREITDANWITAFRGVVGHAMVPAMQPAPFRVGLTLAPLAAHNSAPHLRTHRSFPLRLARV